MILLYWRDTIDVSHAIELVTKVRELRTLGYTPVISVSEKGFECISDFWPRFMFSRTEKKMEKGSIAWVKRLLRLETKDTTVTILPNNLQTGFIGEQILEKSAIPIDGVWVSLEVTL